MSRVLVLAVDALDVVLLKQFRHDLPNISRLIDQGRMLEVRSTFPPDSDTAWATATTGLSPAEHGVVRFVDPLRKSYEILNVGSKNEEIHGKTIWDVAGAAGKRCTVVFPHLGHPLWPQRGPVKVVARASASPEVSADPASLLDHYPDPSSIHGTRGFPGRRTKDLLRYRERVVRQARADADFGLALMAEEDWDLFYIYWSTIDAVGHFFWSYFDSRDPAHKPGHELARVIPETYMMFDGIVGSYLSRLDSATSVVLLSDHGHAGRPQRLVSVNVILRDLGLLRVRDARKNPHLRLMEQSKRLAVRAVSRFGLARTAGRVVRRIPAAMDAFIRPSSIDWKRTIAYASDMSGIKAYNYGGININRELLTGDRQYQEVRRAIIDSLHERCIGADGEPLLKFARERETLYRGPHLDRYPDILVQFIDDHGLGWSADGPLFTRAASRNLVPGSHRSDTATFVVKSERAVAPAITGLDLVDVTPTLLDLLGLSHDRYGGRSILSSLK